VDAGEHAATRGARPAGLDARSVEADAVRRVGGRGDAIEPPAVERPDHAGLLAQDPEAPSAAHVDVLDLEGEGLRLEREGAYPVRVAQHETPGRQVEDRLDAVELRPFDGDLGAGRRLRRLARR